MPVNEKILHYLIIDDDAVFAGVLQRALHHRNFNTGIAANERQAWELLRQFTVQRTILDLKLEHEYGLALIPKLKRHDAAMEIVVLTGFSSIVTAVEAIKLGATQYLCKPADTDEIIAAFAGSSRIAAHQDTPSIKRLEWEHIQSVLNQHNGNISASARSLGMHRRTLQRKLQKRPVKK